MAEDNDDDEETGYDMRSVQMNSSAGGSAEDQECDWFDDDA